MKKLFFVLGVFIFSGLAHAGDTPPLWEDGIKAYESGDYIQAADRFEKLARSGVADADLFYNLGNVYYRQGQRGEAILWYERARRLAPRDSDVVFNLKLARSHIKNDGDNIFRRAAGIFNLNELGWASMLLSWIFFVALGLRFLGKLQGETWPFVTLWMSGLLLLFTGSWLGWAVWDHSRPAAVITQPPGEVRNGPGLEYAVGFTVPEGSRILILNKRPDWSQVGVPHEGLKGWMPTEDFKEIAVETAGFNPQKFG